MNWKNIYDRVPDRVLYGISGLTVALLSVSAPRLLAWWIRLWS